MLFHAQEAARRPLLNAIQVQFPVVPLTIVKTTLLHSAMGPATVCSSTGVQLGHQTGCWVALGQMMSSRPSGPMISYLQGDGRRPARLRRPAHTWRMLAVWWLLTDGGARRA